MLFDLRGRGRRRTVQAIYITLAVLMGGGLIFFGIGGSVSGGLFDAIGITGNNSGGGSGGNDILAKQARTAERRVRLNPADAGSWATIARIRYQEAGQGSNYDQARGTFTPAGLQQLVRATSAWERYLKLERRHPDPNIAALMVQAYAPTALNQPQSGVLAAEIVASSRPSAQTYYQLAVFAYSAKQTRKGDLASRQAVAKTPPADRPSVKSQLDAIKKQGGPTQGSAGASAVSPTG
jgi:hypothetical protein